jgi:nitronate monooxygenase
VLDLRDLDLPVIAAPMAGGPTTPALAAAVSNVGGLGVLAAGYKTADQVATDVDAFRAASSGPLGLNLFVGEPYDADAAAVASYRHSLEPEAARLGVELGEPTWDDDHWDAKLELVFDVRPDVVSFVFGCPSEDVLRRLADVDVLTTVTVTTLAEALAASARGAASLAVQGTYAGGHRGTWDLDAQPDTTPLLDLVADIAATIDVPVVAGGGVSAAADVAALLDRGAVAAQVGTAYLLANEAGTNPVHRAGLVDSAFAETAVTRAYTGRWARGLANRFIAEHADAPAGYPQLHHVTAPLRAAAIRTNDPQVAHMWAGTGHRQARAASAADITRSLDPGAPRSR